MKKRLKKLTLNKETVLHLSTLTLTKAVGLTPGNSGNSDCYCESDFGICETKSLHSECYCPSATDCAVCAPQTWHCV